MNEQPQSIEDILTKEPDFEVQLEKMESLGHRYASEGKYDLAKQCFKKIEGIKKNIKEKKRHDLEEQQYAEMENLEQSYVQEIEKVNAVWDKKFEDLQKRSQIAEDDINKRQYNEMEKLYAEMEEKMNQKIKFSKEYLALESQEKMLVKFQKFDEAKVIKKKKEQQKAKDIEKWNKEKNAKIKVQAIKKNNKHVNEKNVLKKKFETELDILRVEKQKEIALVEKKFQNKKLELDLQQKNERNLNENENISRKRQFGISYFGNQTEIHHSRMNTNVNQREEEREIINDHTDHEQMIITQPPEDEHQEDALLKSTKGTGDDTGSHEIEVKEEKAKEEKTKEEKKEDNQEQNSTEQPKVGVKEVTENLIDIQEPTKEETKEINVNESQKMENFVQPEKTN